MKRSQMVDFLALELIELGDSFVDPRDLPKYKNKADKLLMIIETMGAMIPSTVMYPATGEYGTVKEVFEYADIDGHIQWEDEDES